MPDTSRPIFVRTFYRQEAIDHYVKDADGEDWAGDVDPPRLGVLWMCLATLVLTAGLLWSYHPAVQVRATVARILPPARGFGNDHGTTAEIILSGIDYDVVARAGRVSICQPAHHCEAVVRTDIRRGDRTAQAGKRQSTSVSVGATPGGELMPQTTIWTFKPGLNVREGDLITVDVESDSIMGLLINVPRRQ